jgi:hypothetical protein
MVAQLAAILKSSRKLRAASLLVPAVTSGAASWLAAPDDAEIGSG